MLGNLFKSRHTNTAENFRPSYSSDSNNCQQRSAPGARLGTSLHGRILRPAQRVFRGHQLPRWSLRANGIGPDPADAPRLFFKYRLLPRHRDAPEGSPNIFFNSNMILTGSAADLYVPRINEAWIEFGRPGSPVDVKLLKAAYIEESREYVPISFMGSKPQAVVVAAVIWGTDDLEPLMRGKYFVVKRFPQREQYQGSVDKYCPVQIHYPDHGQGEVPLPRPPRPRIE